MDPIPFQEVLWPRARKARQRLQAFLADSGHAPVQLTEEAWLDLELSLVRRLSELGWRALEADFDAARGGRPDAFAARLAALRGSCTSSRYQEFVADQLREEEAWVGRWPVLARLFATTIEGWVRNSAEMLRRLEADRPQIARLLSHRDSDELGPVSRLAGGLSDPHHGGRSVHVLTFEGEVRVVYKPRACGLDVAFPALLDWCNERGLSLRLQGARGLDRGEYGWAEHIVPRPCPDDAAARRFHRRAGMLLGLLHGFGSRDCHYENLVANGEHPILIDVESWLPVRLRKWLPGTGWGEAWYQAAAQLERSVLSTGLLPRWQEGPRRGELRDVGGLGGGQPETRLATEWLNVNSDLMVRSRRECETPAQPNVPLLAGRPLEPWDFRAEVVAGFCEMYELLLRHRRELLAADGPLETLAGRRARLIFRTTSIYHRLLERSLSPECCRDEAARHRALEDLARVYADGEGRPVPWPLLDAERRALWRADVPLFLAPVEGPRIEIPGGGSVEDALSISSLAAARENLQTLCDDDRRLQVGFIHAALASRQLAAADGWGGPEATTEGDRFLAAAAAIATRLHDRAILGADGSATWIGPRYLASGMHYELAVVGADLYAGTAGIALFLAAFARAVDDARSRDLALLALAPLRRNLAAGRRLGPRPGGLTGLPSLLLAFRWIGELLGEPALIHEAIDLAAQLTPESIAADDDLDIVAGSAGTILALLDFESCCPPPVRASILELAGACADHLLARRTFPEPGLAAWPVRGEPPLAGFAHGAAGIGYALLRLHARTGRSDLWEAGRAALAFAKGRERNEGTWCYGPPGIALARLGVLDVLGGGDNRDELQAALAATRREHPTAIDHLCCGNLGRVEILLQAASLLSDDDLLGAARQLACRVLRRAEQYGNFGCAPFGCPDLSDPTLFRGEAGIGLTLLRLAGRDDLPCPLLLAAHPVPRPHDTSLQ